MPTVVFTCRAQQVLSTPHSHVDETGGKSKSWTTYRLSFLGSTVKFLSGDSQLFKRLPERVPIILDLNDYPFTQWDGETVEVSGSTYDESGIFAADKLFIADLKITIPKSATVKLPQLLVLAILGISALGICIFAYFFVADRLCEPISPANWGAGEVVEINRDSRTITIDSAWSPALGFNTGAQKRRVFPLKPLESASQIQVGDQVNFYVDFKDESIAGIRAKRAPRWWTPVLCRG